MKGKPETILIVEDNDLTAKLFRDLLEAHRYKTIHTVNGLEGLKLVRDHHPDLIIMDIGLPDVSGTDVIRWIREDDDLRAIPIIAVSPYGMKDQDREIRQSGCDDHVIKPICVANFLDTVRRFLS